MGKLVAENGTVLEEISNSKIREGDALEFEDIIEDLGSFGYWQRVIFFLICLMDIFGAFAMFSPVFTGATPRWRCANYSVVMADDALAGNVSDVVRNVTDDVTAAFFQCRNPGGAKCEGFVYDRVFSPAGLTHHLTLAYQFNAEGEITRLGVELVGEGQVMGQARG